MRKLLVHMNKSGLTFVPDRATGEFLGVFSVPELQDWITGVTEDGKLVGRKEPEPGKPLNYCPSVAGAKSWNSMAYSPRRVSSLRSMPASARSCGVSRQAQGIADHLSHIRWAVNNTSRRRQDGRVL
jgi:hypothetical protein